MASLSVLGGSQPWPFNPQSAIRNPRRLRSAEAVCPPFLCDFFVPPRGRLLPVRRQPFPSEVAWTHGDLRGVAGDNRPQPRRPRRGRPAHRRCQPAWPRMMVVHRDSYHPRSRTQRLQPREPHCGSSQGFWALTSQRRDGSFSCWNELIQVQCFCECADDGVLARGGRR